MHLSDSNIGKCALSQRSYGPIARWKEKAGLPGLWRKRDSRRRDRSRHTLEREEPNSHLPAQSFKLTSCLPWTRGSTKNHPGMEAEGSSRKVTRLLRLGVKEDSEEQHDVKAEAFFQAGEGRDEQGAQGQPGVGAVGTEGEGEELNGGKGHFGPGAPGPMGDGDKDSGTRAGGVEQEQNEPVAEGTESQENGNPGGRQMPLQGSRFAQHRLRELESILQRTNSFDVPREDLDRLMDACVSRVQNWFKIRRAAARRNRRRATPVPEHFRGTFECPACRGVRWGERCPFATPRF